MPGPWTRWSWTRTSPDLSGLEVLRLGRQLHPDLESVLVTAYPSTDSAIQAMEAGFYDYLKKPLDDIELLPARSTGPWSARRSPGSGSG